MPRTSKREQEGVITRDRAETREPSMYKVLLLNDNYTSMEFVVLILERVFRKAPGEAQRIMLSVHQSGSGVAGIYTKDIAETRIAVVHQLARQNEFPLRCAMEPA